MQNPATVDDPAPTGVLGANESNIRSAPSRTARTIGDDAPVVACRQCRSRKVRCDSSRPMCTNCTRRSDPCEYDAVPRRRGPDKEPGTRLRLYKKRPEDVPASSKQVTKPRAKESSNSNSPEQRELQGPQRTARKRQKSGLSRKPHEEEGRVLAAPSPLPQALIPRPQTDQTPTPGITDDDLDATFRLIGFGSLEGLLRVTKGDDFIAVPETCGPAVNDRYMNWKSNRTSAGHGPTSRMGIYLPANGHISDSVTESYIPRGPSSSFHKQTWWDSLLSLYSDDHAQSALRVFQDLTFLLNNDLYWLSFISFPRFMDSLYDPDARIFVQPSVVLAALALATIMKSSEIGLGGEGRKLALWLRDSAQSSLDASISASWIEPSLAQAAFFLARFEATSHPIHSGPRLSSSIWLLDSLIQALSLTTIDALEPTVTTFRAGELPSVTSYPSGGNYPQTTAKDLQSKSFENGDTNLVKCTCGKVAAIPGVGVDSAPRIWGPLQHSLGQNFDKLNTTIPSNGKLDSEGRTSIMADWPEATNVAETQKEECRRLCWSSMMLITALREYTPLEFDRSVWDLHVTKPENFALFFPGEKVCKTDPKASIWALHGRAAILWNSCQKLRSQPDWEYRRTDLAGRAWMEANAIEDALESHACPAGHGVPHAGREYLLQLKLLLTNQFTTSAPIPHTLGLYKDSAKEWLTHRARISSHVRKTVYFITRFGVTLAALTLAKRPLSIWWAMYQIKAGTMIWKSDPTLSVALEQSVEFLAIVDFMSAVWPSDLQRRHYNHIRTELLQCCVFAGIRVPAPIPIPGLPVDLHATMIPPLVLKRNPTPADIPMVPLD